VRIDLELLKKINQIQPSMGDAEKRELASVIDSGWFTEAKKTREFEKMFSNFIGSKYSCAVTSGTAGLYLALKAVGIGSGDEVIVPALTFIASPNSIEATGAKPILIDIESQSLNLDLQKLSHKITKKTKAIMPVNFNGRSTNYDLLCEFANKHSLMLIEDAAHSLGCYYQNKHQGTLSDMSIFSFSTPKIITTGQGGMIVTNNKKLFERCLQLKDFGRDFGKKKNMRKAFEHSTIGYNYKFTEFQAAVGIAQMKKLEKRIRKKRKTYKKYVELLSKINQIDFIQTDLKKITPWMVDILLQSKITREKLIKYLEQRNIETRIFYPSIHKLPPYRENNKKYPVSTNISDRGLWLPSSVTIKDEEIDLISRKIREFFK